MSFDACTQCAADTVRFKWGNNTQVKNGVTKKRHWVEKWACAQKTCLLGEETHEVAWEIGFEIPTPPRPPIPAGKFVIKRTGKDGTKKQTADCTFYNIGDVGNHCTKVSTTYGAWYVPPSP